MQPDWHSPDYLLQGSPAMQQAHRVLKDLHIPEILKPFRAVLTGSFPLNLNIPESDLDICCQTASLPALALACRQAFGMQDSFSVKEKQIAGEQTLLVRFFYKGLLIEIFGQLRPVHEQHAFRHMLAEYTLLQQYGEPLRQKVIELKKAGNKTEPAFAKALGLEGNPYEILLAFAPE